MGCTVLLLVFALAAVIAIGVLSILEHVFGSVPPPFDMLIWVGSLILSALLLAHPLKPWSDRLEADEEERLEARRRRWVGEQNESWFRHLEKRQGRDRAFIEAAQCLLKGHPIGEGLRAEVEAWLQACPDGLEGRRREVHEAYESRKRALALAVTRVREVAEHHGVQVRDRGSSLLLFPGNDDSKLLMTIHGVDGERATFLCRRDRFAEYFHLSDDELDQLPTKGTLWDAEQCVEFADHLRTFVPRDTTV